MEDKYIQEIKIAINKLKEKWPEYEYMLLKNNSFDEFGRVLELNICSFKAEHNKEKLDQTIAGTYEQTELDPRCHAHVNYFFNHCLRNDKKYKINIHWDSRKPNEVYDEIICNCSINGFKSSIIEF